MPERSASSPLGGGCGIGTFEKITLTLNPPSNVMNKLFEPNEFDKKKPQIVCPCCSRSLFTRSGTYLRAHPEKPGQVKIQQYLCKSPDCPTKTFSVLEYPFLRIIRHFYPSVERCCFLCTVTTMNQACVARKMTLTQGIVKRLKDFDHRLFPWIDHEKNIADWGLILKNHTGF